MQNGIDTSREILFFELNSSETKMFGVLMGIIISTKKIKQKFQLFDNIHLKSLVGIIVSYE